MWSARSFFRASSLVPAVLGALFPIVAVSMPATAEPLQELNFGFVSTESSQTLRQRYDPFLADMERGLGMKVKPFFATDYAGVIEAMRFGKVQIARYGNKSAAEAVDRANGEVAFRALNDDGTTGYHSILIVHRDSEIRSVEDVLRDGSRYSFGNGDPNSTSGFLVPGYYLWAQNKIDPKTLFKRSITANHETNLLAVINRQVDVATNNDAQLERLRHRMPDKAAQIRVIWTSPLIPNDPIVWRQDLDPEVKRKLSAFFLGYGVDGPPERLEQQRAILKGLGWERMVASTNAQLIPTRQLDLFTAKLKTQNDTTLGDAEKQARIAEIDRKLAALGKQPGS
jgi:phosphonate transport system substrate-binding protein